MARGRALRLREVWLCCLLAAGIVMAHTVQAVNTTAVNITERVVWRPGEVDVNISTVNGTAYDLALSATRLVTRSGVGHYSLRITWMQPDETLTNTTDCIEYHATQSQIADAISAIDFVSDMGDFTVTRFGNGSNGWRNGYEITINIPGALHNVSSNVSVTLEGVGEAVQCAEPITKGFWNDSSNWEDGVVPSPTSATIFPEDSGIIVLDVDADVAALIMRGGQLQTYKSTCTGDWVPGAQHGKCYQFFNEPQTFAGAEATCGSLDGAFRKLAQVNDLEENRLVQLMCRDRGRELGCWLGLTDAVEQGAFLWQVPSDMEEERFRSWHRFEPDNQTTLTGGEDCVYMLPWYSDPLQQERSQWADTWCFDERLFVCERAGSTTLNTLSVSVAADLSDCTIEGSGEVIFGPDTTVVANGTVTLTNGVTMTTQGVSVWSAHTVINGLAALVNSGAMLVEQQNASEPYLRISDVDTWFPTDEDFYPVQGRGVFRNDGSGGVLVSEGSSVRLDVVFENQGLLELEGSLLLTGGGYTHQGEISLESNDSDITLDGGSFLMHSTSTYVLTIEAEKAVVGDYSGLRSKEVDGNFDGTYRLSATVGNDTEISSCLPYNITASALQSALNSLDTVGSLGGVNVFRSGDGSRSWNFGYKYTIEFDAVPTEDQYLLGTISVECQGKRGCGCSELLASSEGGCKAETPSRFQNTSLSNSSLCTVVPELTMQEIGTGSAAVVNPELSIAPGRQQSRGSVTVHSGIHRFTPQLPASLFLTGGAALFANPTTAISGTIGLNDSGWLVFAGVGFEGWNAATLLYLHPETRNRGDAAVRESPTTRATMGDIIMEGGYFVCAALDSQMSSRSLLWVGGVFSGTARLTANESLVVTDADTAREKQLRNTFGLALGEAGTGAWVRSDVIMREGSSFLVNGYMTLLTTDGPQIGSPELPEDVIGAATETLGEDDAEQIDYSRVLFVEYNSLNTWEDGKQYSGTFWYSNPLCSSACHDPATFVVGEYGVVETTNNSLAGLSAVAINLGRITVVENSTLDFAAGGTSYGIVEVGGTVALSGGVFRFTARATLSKTGVIRIDGGSHILPPTVTPFLNLVAGEVLTQNTIARFENGLLIENLGTLRFSTIGVNATIKGNLTMSGGLMAFPETNAMPALHPAHLTSSERHADRGKVFLKGSFVWSGGRIRGDAELLAEQGMTIKGGPMYVEALAHVVNLANAVWDSGDIVASEQGYFFNLGTVQVADAENFAGKLLYLDSFDGCCPYDSKELFAWE